MKNIKRQVWPMRRKNWLVYLTGCFIVSTMLGANIANALGNIKTQAQSSGGQQWGLAWWDYDSANDTNIRTPALAHSAAASHNERNAWVPNPNSSYDPNQPTIIYFHGWQLGNIGENHEEDFIFHNHGDSSTNVQSINTLRAWKNAGFNVGVFYWTPWADDGGRPSDTPQSGAVSDLVSFDVAAAENKIWTANSTYGMRYKYRDSNGNADFRTLTKNDGPAERIDYSRDIRLKAFNFNYSINEFNDEIQETRWHNANSTSQAKSAMKYILNDFDYSSFLAVRQLRESIGPQSDHAACVTFVERLACNMDLPTGVQSNSTWSCNEVNRQTWNEVFVPQVCETPNISVMAAEQLRIILNSQVNDDVRFVGHSLGNQLATSVATRLWWMNRSGTANYSGLPKRLALLDPYYSSASKPGIRRYYHDRTPLQQVTAQQTWHKAYNYARALDDMSRTVPLANLRARFPISFFDTSYLSDFYPSGNPAEGLRSFSAYTKLDLRYIRVAGFADPLNRHVGGRHWYFASFDGAKRPLNSSYRATTSGQALLSRLGSNAISAKTSKATILKAMGEPVVDQYGNMTSKLRNSRMGYVQTAGQDTFTVNDDQFTVVGDRQETSYVLRDQGGETRSLLLTSSSTQQPRSEHDFSNQLTITADNKITKLYVNGQRINSLPNSSNWTVNDVLDNLDLHGGANVIAVEADDAGGIAALLAQVTFGSSRSGSNGSWKVSRSFESDWYKPEFDDSGWSHATEHYDYGTGPWGSVVGGDYSRESGWIWSELLGAHNKVYFRWVFHTDVTGWKIKQVVDPNPPGRFDHTGFVSMINSAASDGSLEDYESLHINFSDSSDPLSSPTGQYPAGEQQFHDYTPGYSVAMLATTTVNVVEAGCYTFRTNANDVRRLTIDGSQKILLTGQRGIGESFADIYLDSGIHSLELLYGTDGGGALVELSVAPGWHNHFNHEDSAFSLVVGGQELYGGQHENCNGGPTQLTFTNARQIDTGWGGDALRARDGNINPEWSGNSVSHTLSNTNAWWEGSLPRSETISKVVIYNRKGFENRLRNFYIVVHDQPFNISHSYSQRYDFSNKYVSARGTEFSIPNATGRYVTIVNIDNYLHMAEVQAFR